MENKKINVEETIKNDLHQYLTSIDRVGQHLPEAPDLEALWAKNRRKLSTGCTTGVQQISYRQPRLDHVRGYGFGKVLG